jgi:hypothetical protein
MIECGLSGRFPMPLEAKMITEQSKPTAKATSDWPKPPFKRPKTWTEIERGSLVVVHESADVGWWEAVVVSKNGDAYTLFFRDCPEQGTLTRNTSQIAQLKP